MCCSVGTLAAEKHCFHVLRERLYVDGEREMELITIFDFSILIRIQNREAEKIKLNPDLCNVGTITIQNRQPDVDLQYCSTYAIDPSWLLTAPPLSLYTLSVKYAFS